MSDPLETGSSKRRRTLLRLIGATAGAGTLQGTLDASAAEQGGSIVMEQGDRCFELVPLEGPEPVEEYYDYTYPTDRYDGPPGSQGNTYSSEGTTHLQQDRTSILFLYDGPNGLSLVVVHGHLDGDRDAGGTIRFRFRGMPEGATWVVRDDHYLRDGAPATSNVDRWNVDGDVHVVDWGYRGGRTDGGVVRGLGSDFEITVEPAFNDEAIIEMDRDVGPIEAWEAISGDGPDRFPLRLDRPVTIRTGTCEGTADREAAIEDDERRGKHERKQRKHREKHQRKQEKHQKKQRKHQRKRRKHRKHGG